MEGDEEALKLPAGASLLELASSIFLQTTEGPNQGFKDCGSSKPAEFASN